MDEKLLKRTRKALEGKAAEEKETCGGLAFVVRGEVCVEVIGAELAVRIGPEQYQEVVRLPYVRPMDYAGRRPREGMVYVASGGVKNDASVRRWVDRGLAYVQSARAPSITRREHTLPRQERVVRK